MFRLRRCLVVLLAAMVGCSTKDPVGPGSHPQYSYTLEVTAAHPDSVYVNLRVSGDDPARQFILPYYYGDNPVDSFSGPLARDLAVGSDTGPLAGWVVDSEQVGLLRCGILKIPQSAPSPFQIRYRIDLGALVEDSSRRYLPDVRFDGQTGFLVGNYLFPLPHIGTDLAVLWRSPVDVQLAVHVAPGLSYAGVPSTARYSTLYQLLFVQIVLGAQPIAEDFSGTPPFRLFDLSRAVDPTAENIAQTQSALRTIFNEITPRFGTFGEGAYTLAFIDFGGGAMEGTHGFLCDVVYFGPDGELPMVLAHEAFHHFIGVHCGEYDDPWWKESVASYLGIAVPSRLGLMKKEYVRNSLLREFRPATHEQGYTLSSPALRNDLYPKGLGNLVYWRGAQVVMLMDRAVRRQSGNRVIVEDVMASLVKRFTGAGFRRSDLVNQFQTSAAVDISPLLATYVDSMAIIDSLTLAVVLDELDSLGAFGQ